MKKHLSLLLSLLLLLLGVSAISEDGDVSDELQVPVYLELLKDAYDNMENATFGFADIMAPMNARPEADNNFPYLGLSLHIPDALLAAIEANEVFLYAPGLHTGCLDFRYIPENVRYRTPSLENYEEVMKLGVPPEDYILINRDFLEWFQQDLEPLAQVIIFSDDEMENADFKALTGYPHSEIVAQHNGYSLIYSSVPEESLSDEALVILPALEAMRDALALEEVRPPDEAFMGYMNPPLTAKGDATHFATQDISGNSITQTIFSESKLTLLNVWTTWCSPCIAEMPYLNELHAEMAGQGVQVVGILYDGVDVKTYAPNEEAIETAQAILEELGVSFPCILPDTALMEGLLSEMQVYPTSFFIDAEGNIVGDPVAGNRDKAEWKTIIEKRLTEIGG